MSFVRLFEKSDNSVSIPTWEQGVNFRCPVFTFKTVFICFASHNIIEEMTLLCLFWITTIYYCITMFISKIDFLEQRSTISFTDDLRRCHASLANLPSSVKYPGRFVSLSSLKFKLLMSTIHRSPLADDQKKQETTTDDTHQPWRLGPTTTALTQQPTWDSRRDFVDILRERRSINRCHRTVDCCIVALVIAVFLLTHRNSWIDRFWLFCFKIAGPFPHYLPHESSAIWFESTAVLLQAVFNKKCEYYMVIYCEKCNCFAA